MTNPLNQVNEAIINDPHGSVARHASHWLAVEVMGWPYVDDPNHFVGYFIPFDVYEKLEGYRGVSECGSGCMMDKEVWQPLTDPEHAHMLFVKRDSLIALDPPDAIGSIIALSILEDLHNEGTLTNDTLKGWMEND